MSHTFAARCRRWLGRLLLPLLLGVGTGAHAVATYDAATGVLTIPLVIVGTTAYTNVQVWVDPAGVVSIGGVNTGNAAMNAADTFSGSQLRIAALQVGNTIYSDVQLLVALANVRAVGGATPTPAAAPLLAVINPLPAATVGTAYAVNVVAAVWPAAQYTFGIDTLANGVLPAGMTIDLNGNLSGTPFATGKTDINGNQIPNTYTFGVCATDTFSRWTTSPCPQTTITVNPAPVTLNVAKAGTGSGSVNSVTAGISCGATCAAKLASGTTVTLVATPASGSSFAGWSGGGCSGTGSCTVTLRTATTVTATFNVAAHALVGTWQWAGPGANGCFFNDGGAFSMSVTLSGSSFSATNVSAAGVETRSNSNCALMSTDTHSGGTGSGTISGSTVTINFTVPGTSLTFNGTGTISGSTVNIPIVRTTGGAGMLNLTLQ